MRLERRSSVYFVISFRVSARAYRATIMMLLFSLKSDSVHQQEESFITQPEFCAATKLHHQTLTLSRSIEDCIV